MYGAREKKLGNKGKEDEVLPVKSCLVNEISLIVFFCLPSRPGQWLGQLERRLIETNGEGVRVKRMFPPPAPLISCRSSSVHI